MKSRLFCVLVSVVFLVACGSDTPVGQAEFDANSGKIIVGSVDWREVTELSSSNPVRKNSRAVADIQFANGGRCTGFFITNDVLMTNHHCIDEASDLIGMKVYMKHEKGVSKSNWASVNCSQFIGANSTLDFALVKCSSSPGSRYGKVQLDSSSVVDGSDIYVVHQNCDYYSDYDCDWSKKYSFGKIVEIDGDVFYDADTLGGSSGSPVFSEDNNKVVAIHHAGYGGNWYGRGEKNAGVPMSKIVPFIQRNFPSVFSSSSGDDSDDTDSTDSSDDNDTISKATNLGSAKSFSTKITSGDVDFYKAYASKGQVLNFKIKFKHSEGDLDFKVYKKSGSSYKVVSSKTSSTNDESVRLRTSSSGYYYFKVYGYKSAKADYKLEFNKY